VLLWSRIPLVVTRRIAAANDRSSGFARRAGRRFRRDLPVLELIGIGGKRSIAQYCRNRRSTPLCDANLRSKSWDDRSDYVRIQHGGPFMPAHHTPGTIRDRTRSM